jgi:hypothetical protein
VYCTPRLQGHLKQLRAGIDPFPIHVSHPIPLKMYNPFDDPPPPYVEAAPREGGITGHSPSIVHTFWTITTAVKLPSKLRLLVGQFWARRRVRKVSIVSVVRLPRGKLPLASMAVLRPEETLDLSFQKLDSVVQFAIFELCLKASLDHPERVWKVASLVIEDRIADRASRKASCDYVQYDLVLRGTGRG